MGSNATSLALALSGFSVEAASEGSEAPLAPPLAAAAATAALRPVAEGAAALVGHASVITTRVLERWQAPGYNPEHDGEQLAALCFALQSTVGQGGRLSDADERKLFELASALWSASLQALSAPGSGSCDMSAALERLGNELFALVDGDSDNTQDCARCEEQGLGGSHMGAAAKCINKACLTSQPSPCPANADVAFFSGLASSWQAAGQGERAKWCLERAMRHNQQVGAGCWKICRAGDATLLHLGL